jgi:hypothetical protein
MTDIIFEPDENKQQWFQARYFQGCAEAYEILGFVNTLKANSDVEFTTEQIKEFVLTKMAIDGNIQISSISQMSEQCDCEEHEKDEEEF